MTAVRLRPTGTNRVCPCGTVLAADNSDNVCHRCRRHLRRQTPSPPQVTEDFWAHPTLARALSTQNMGALLEAYRHHPGHAQRISQERMAEWLGVSQAQLSRYEHDPKPLDRLDRLRHFATMLDIPERYLWFTLSDSAKPTLPAQGTTTDVLTAPWDAPTAARSTEETTRSDLVLSRRAALTGVTAVAVGPALIEPLQQWLIPLRRWARMSAGSGISDDEVAALRGITEGMRDWNRGNGEGLARKAVLGQLNEVAERLRYAPDGPNTRETFFLGAELAKIAASMSWDAGLHDSAQRYYVLAVRMAKAGGNAEFGALCLAAMARQMFDLGRPLDGLDLVQLGQYGVRRSSSPVLRALLHSREAWAYALLGRVQDFHRAIGQAQDCFGTRGDSTEPGWLSSFDEAEMEGIIGARMRDLAKHDPQQALLAEQHIRKALALRHPSRVRNRVFDVIGLARTRLAMNEPEGACELVQSILPTVDQIGSGRVSRKLQDFVSESAIYRRLSSVRDVHDAIRTVRIA